MRPRKLPIAALTVLRAGSIPIAASKESVAAARAIHAGVPRAPAARQTGDPPASTSAKTLTFAVDAERSAIRTARTSCVAATAEAVNIRAPPTGADARRALEGATRTSTRWKTAAAAAIAALPRTAGLQAASKAIARRGALRVRSFVHPAPASRSMTSTTAETAAAAVHLRGAAPRPAAMASAE
jgi:hypothetical protein